MPPPVHGSSIVGKIIAESDFINNKFKTTFINLLLSKKVAESGGFSIMKFIFFLRQLYQILLSINKEKPDLCYFALSTTGLAFYKDCLLVTIIKMNKIKILYHLHNKGVSNYSRKIMHKYLYKLVFSGSKVILLSKSIYSDIKKYVLLENVYICPNGIPEHDLYNLKRDHNVVNLLFISNLIESKGIFDLLDACKILASKNLSFNCTIIGDEGDVTKKDLLYKIEKLNLSPYINYLGPQYGKNKDNILLESDLFVFPTYYSAEIFSLVLIEAMQFSLPLISTFEGGISDLVEDGVTGYLIKQRDVNSLALKLEELILDKDLRIKLGLAGRKRYEQYFTQEIFEKNLTKILSNEL